MVDAEDSTRAFDETLVDYLPGDSRKRARRAA
jgi:hypothetical protein